MDNNQFNLDEMKKKFNMSIKDPKNLVLYIALAVVIVSLFLPFVTIGMGGISRSVSLIDGRGILYIILAVGIALSRLFAKMIPQIAVTGVTVLLFLYDFFSTTSGEFSELVKHALGAYLMLIALAVVAVITVIQFLQQRAK